MARGRDWEEEETAYFIECLQNTNPNLSKQAQYTKIAAQVNERFNNNRSAGSIRNKVVNLSNDVSAKPISHPNQVLNSQRGSFKYQLYKLFIFYIV
jgi:hypothetical protein